MKYIVLFLCVLKFNCCTMKAQPLSYNINRAIEYLEENDYENAKSFINKELENNPRDVISLDLLGYIYSCNQEYGPALNCFNKVICYAKKKDKDILARTYYYRAGIYSTMGDTIKSIADYRESIKRSSEYHRQTYIELGDLLFGMKQYEEANSIYLKMIELESGDPYPFYGMARNSYNNNNYAAARKYISKGEVLDNDNERISIMHMRVEYKSGNYNSAIDYAINALDENEDNSEAFDLLMELSDSIYQTVLNRLIKQNFIKDGESCWGMFLGLLYMKHYEYQKALECFHPIITSDSEHRLFALYGTGRCNEELYNDSEIIRLMDMAIEIDSTDSDFYYMRANAHFFEQHYKEAENDYMKMMELNKDYGYYAYYRLGWIKEMQKDYEAAIVNYNMSIALKEDYAYPYMMKGFLQKEKLGQGKEAKEAFLKCIELDTEISEGTCKQYAYWGLGDKAKAIEVNDSILVKYNNAGSYYDAACLYSRMGNIEEAISCLRKSFEKGYKRFLHIENDNDLDNIRKHPEYEKLLKQYQISECKKHSYSAQSIESFEVPLIKNSDGTYRVKCVINDLPMDFILDTGCSDVSLSSVESEFMLKNGYLSSSDFRGYVNYKNASGDVKKAREIVINEIRIGEKTVKKIKASIIPNQKAPLLLGQNVLNKLGKVEIDSSKRVLIIHTYQ